MNRTGYGHLTVICGPMFSGKTGLLIERVLADYGDKLILKPAFDTRAAGTELIGRAGGRVAALPISSWPSATVEAGVSTIYLDEVQFLESPHFDGDIIAHVGQVLASGVNVVAAGLDLDFQARPFAVTSMLSGMADQVIKLAARCTRCGAPATKSLRRHRADGRMIIGDTELYEAACNQCFGVFRQNLLQVAA